MLKIVTVTGADVLTNPSILPQLQEKYPFVEFAILVQPRTLDDAKPRFPDLSWIGMLAPYADKLNLSLHLCGRFVNEILFGNIDFVSNELARVWSMFQRVQINTHGLAHGGDPVKMVEAMKIWPEKEFIFQYDGKNDHFLYEAANAGVKSSALFDLSHGAGILPEVWPDLLPGIKCGYAGGLSPENVVSQIENIEGFVGDVPIWIDAETHLRGVTASHDYFNIKRVEAFLQNSKPYIR